MTTSSKKTKKYFVELGEKIYLTLDSATAGDCVSVLESMEEDLKLLASINVEDAPLYYNRDEFFLTPDNFPDVSREIENKDLLHSLTNTYEFTHIHKEKKC